jgi:tetratricopeptide (TPR) repeat protein
MDPKQIPILFLIAAVVLGLAFLVLVAVLIALLVIRRRSGAHPIKSQSQDESKQSTTVNPVLSLRSTRNSTITFIDSEPGTLEGQPENEHIRILRKVHELEEEIQELKSLIRRPLATPRERIQKFLNYFAQNWAFLSLIGTILLVIYIQLAFGVDYFESYRDIKISRELSGFYQQQGDTLIGMLELDAAKAAYQRAIDIDKYNQKAMYGLAKAQALDPIEGKKYFVPEVAGAKIEYLLKKFPDDPQLYFLKGQLYYQLNDKEDAIRFTKESINKDPKFTAGYIQLGFLYQDMDIDTATMYYQKAFDEDPNNTMANNNLGFIHMLNGDFKNAIAYLETAYHRSPMLITAVNLGDAHLYSANLPLAKAYYLFALNIIESPSEETERYIGSDWLYNAMPLQPGDKETIKYWAKFSTVDQKRMLIYYDLSFYYALEGNTTSANDYFSKAQELDQSRIYNTFFSAWMHSIENFVPMESSARSWFEAGRGKLGAN